MTLVHAIVALSLHAGPASVPCDLAAGPCTSPAGDLSVTLDLGRELVTMKELPAAVTVRRGGSPLEGASVELSFEMRDMKMGENRVALAAAAGGLHTGKAVLVRCHSGRKDWIATVTVRRPGADPASVAFPFAVSR